MTYEYTDADFEEEELRQMREWISHMRNRVKRPHLEPLSKWVSEAREAYREIEDPIISYCQTCHDLSVIADYEEELNTTTNGDQ